MKRLAMMACFVVVLTAPLCAGPITKNPEWVLDLNEGSWRMWATAKTPTLVSEDGKTLKPLRHAKTRTQNEPGPMLMRHSAYPPKHWAEPDFDDTNWPRARGQVVVPQRGRGSEVRNPAGPASWQSICLRGNFYVQDPKKVNMPRVILKYYGGAVVYVNGKEIQRGHLPEGDIRFDTLADPYSLGQYARPDGKLYGPNDHKNREYYYQFQARVRTIPPKQWTDAVAIPNNLLRKGVNTIAIQVHAAPVNEAAVTRTTAAQWKFGYQVWPHSGVVAARVIVGVPNGLVQNVAPNDGLNVSNEHPWEELYAYDYSHPQPELRPVSLFGVRNGSYSGRLLVSSREDVIDLKVKSTELVHAEGKAKIAVENVRVRFAELANGHVSHRRWPRFDRLLATIPETVRAVPMKIRGRDLQPIPTATIPVWITVDIPKDAAPGQYQGQVTIEAQYAKPVTVPVHLTVYDWALPDTKDYLLNHCMWQSPDSVALFYKTKLWSEKHYELMGQSFAIADKMGSRLIPLPLVIRAPNLNNSQSLVRWVKQDDGTYKYDFTLVERYLDCFEKAVGKPRIIAIYNGLFEGRKNEQKPPEVNTLDPQTQKLGRLTAPPFGTKEYTEFWRPVLIELRERLLKRGWYDATMFAHISYCWNPTKETAAAIKSIWPDGKWISSCHGYRSNFGGLPVVCNEWIWGCGTHYNPDSGGSARYPRPWRKRRDGHRMYDHFIAREFDEDNHLTEFIYFPEREMQRDLHGLGRLGADFWPIRNPKTGRYYYLTDTYAGLGIETSNIALVGPGPNGPVWTERAELFREGVQINETIAYVRNRIDSKKLPEALAKRAEALLFERARWVNWFAIGSLSQNLGRISGHARERTEQLYAIAGEIAKAAAESK
jgi:hypothetical protein